MTFVISVFIEIKKLMQISQRFKTANYATIVLIMNPIYELRVKCKNNKKPLKLVLTTTFYIYPT